MCDPGERTVGSTVAARERDERAAQVVAAAVALLPSPDPKANELEVRDELSLRFGRVAPGHVPRRDDQVLARRLAAIPLGPAGELPLRDPVRGPTSSFGEAQQLEHASVEERAVKLLALSRQCVVAICGDAFAALDFVLSVHSQLAYTDRSLPDIVRQLASANVEGEFNLLFGHLVDGRLGDVVGVLQRGRCI